MHDAEPAGNPSPTAVVLPGTGSDARFVDKAFRAPLERHGIRVVAVEPREPFAAWLL